MWQQLRCVVHSALILVKTIALKKLLGRCIARPQCVWIYFACSILLSNLLNEPTINVLRTRHCATWAMFPLKNNQIRLSWSLAEAFLLLKSWKSQFKMLLEMSFVQHAQTKNVFSFQPTKVAHSATVKSTELAVICWIFHLRTKNWHLYSLVLMVHIVFQKRQVVTKKSKIGLQLWGRWSANHHQAHLNLNQNRQKSFLSGHNRVDSPLVDTVIQKFSSIVFLYTFSPQKRNKIFSVSNDGFEYCLESGPDSVDVTVNDLVQEKPIRFQDIPHAAWSLLMSERQAFLNIELAPVPITPNQEGTLERRDELFSSAGAQDIDTNGYQVSDLDDVDFCWENDQLDVDAVSRPGIETPVFSSTFNDFERGSRAENPIVVDKEPDKKKSPPPPPTTLVSDRPVRPLCWWEVAQLERELGMFPIMFKKFVRIVSYHCYCVCILV